MDSLAEIMARVERLAFAGEAEQQTTPDVALSASPSSDEHSLLPLAVPQAEILLPPQACECWIQVLETSPWSVSVARLLYLPISR